MVLSDSCGQHHLQEANPFSRGEEAATEIFFVIARGAPEALHRRISVAVEFPMPSVAHRAAIWKQHIPDGLKVRGPAGGLARVLYTDGVLQFAADVDWASVAESFDMSGGHIKNSMQALSGLVSVSCLA